MYDSIKISSILNNSFGILQYVKEANESSIQKTFIRVLLQISISIFFSFFVNSYAFHLQQCQMYAKFGWSLPPQCGCRFCKMQQFARENMCKNFFFHLSSTERAVFMGKIWKLFWVFASLYIVP